MASSDLWRFRMYLKRSDEGGGNTAVSENKGGLDRTCVVDFQ